MSLYIKYHHLMFQLEFGLRLIYKVAVLLPSLNLLLQGKAGKLSGKLLFAGFSHTLGS